MIGNFLRRTVPLFRALLLPSPITAGILGLILGPEGLNLIGFSDQLGAYTTLLIAVAFAAMSYSMTFDRGTRAEAKTMWSYSVGMFLGQWGLFILLGVFFFAPVWNTDDWFGMMLPVGFVGKLLLTAVKRPDYVDRETMGSTSGGGHRLPHRLRYRLDRPRGNRRLLGRPGGHVRARRRVLRGVLLHRPRYFGENWLERGIFGWGWATAAVATGIALLKIVDPKMESGTLNEYGVAYIGFAPFEIGMTILAPIAVIAGWTLGLGVLSLLLALVVLALPWILKWLPHHREQREDAV